MTWQIVKLGEIFNFLPKSKLQASNGQENGKYKFFTSSLIQKKWIDTATFDGEALVLGTGGSASIHHVDGGFSTSTDCFVLAPKNNEELFAKYVYYYISSNLHILEEGFKGAGLKHISKKYIHDLEIPLPPYAEQQRLAEILDKTELVKRKRELAIEKLDELAQSVFIDMFGDLEINSHGLELKKLSSLLTIQGGYAFKSSDFVGDGIKLLKISNVHKDNLTWRELDFLPSEYIEKHKSFALVEQDIVLALTRPIIKSLSSVKVAVVTAEDLPCLLNQRVARFIFTKSSKILPSFLLMLLKSKYFYNLVDKLCSVALQPNMSTKQLGDLKIPLPPLEQQYKFEKILHKLNSLKNKNSFCNNGHIKLLNSLNYASFPWPAIENE
jgi:type I restriction enzyme S subunit